MLSSTHIRHEIRTYLKLNCLVGLEFSALARQLVKLFARARTGFFLPAIYLLP